MEKAITAIVIGVGDRGNIYGDYALLHLDKIEIVGVAEPRLSRREMFARKHNILEDQVFDNWEAILKQDKIADTAIITTPDHLHIKPAIMAMEKGYDVLLEKPMATTLEDCQELAEKAQELNRTLQICHVLR